MANFKSDFIVSQPVVLCTPTGSGCLHFCRLLCLMLTAEALGASTGSILKEAAAFSGGGREPP